MNQFKETKDLQERIRLLNDNCDEKEQKNYVKPLSQEELDQKHEQLADNCIEVNRLEEELTGIKKQYKGKIEPMKAERNTLLLQIKTRQEQARGTVYHFFNHETGFRETFDENGDMIESRRLSPEERQLKAPFLKAQ